MNEIKTSSGADASKIKVYAQKLKYTWKPWQPGYEDCPGYGPCPCERICPMCGAGSGKIGIGCLECQMCFAPEEEA